MPPESLYIAEDEAKEVLVKTHEVLSACQDLIGKTGALND